MIEYLLSVLVSIFLITVFYFLFRIFSKNSIPIGLRPLPGIAGWPFVGNLFSIKEPLWSIFYKHAKTYGEIFKYQIGNRDLVVINSSKMLFKTLKDQGINFSGRQQNGLLEYLTHDSGIVFKEKEWWSTQRSFALKVLRDFGLGKQRSTEIVNNECSVLIQELQEKSGQNMSTKSCFPNVTVNIIAKFLMNMRFEKDSSEFFEFRKIIEQTTHNRSFLTILFQIYSIPKCVVPFCAWLTGLKDHIDTVHNFVINIINERKKIFSYENEGEDFIDMFLIEKHKLESENKKNHTFTDWQLIRAVVEIFGAGFETTSTTLSWAMILLARHGEIQEKVHQEIINLIGPDKIPDLHNKKFLNYTQAVMDEIFRISTVAPLAIPHRVFNDTEANGFFIPKDSIIFTNLYACHRDENVWEKPFEFYPEHFLIKSDNGDIKYTPREELVPFSTGKRQCLGESLARLEYFIFLTSILQRFKVKFAKEIDEITYEKITRGTDGSVRAPLDIDVVFEMRS